MLTAHQKAMLIDAGRKSSVQHTKRATLFAVVVPNFSYSNNICNWHAPQDLPALRHQQCCAVKFPFTTSPE
jgi:hypothetical protein